jgi:c-di-GMP-binding flagellar brake protein YcgR
MGLFKKSERADNATEATEWPNINELLWIRLPCCETSIHPTRVEDRDGDLLVVAWPSKPHIEPVAKPFADSTFVIGWREGAGTKQARVTVESADDTTTVPTWKLRQQSKPEAVQRRRFVRADWDRKIDVYLPLKTVEGDILDVSEGGIRATIEAANEPRSPFLQVSFELEGETLVLETEVAWWGTPADGKVTIGLQFVNQGQALTDRLRAFAFQQQLKQREK